MARQAPSQGSEPLLSPFEAEDAAAPGARDAVRAASRTHQHVSLSSDGSAAAAAAADTGESAVALHQQGPSLGGSEYAPLSPFASEDADEAPGVPPQQRPSSGGSEPAPLSPFASAEADEPPAALPQQRPSSGGGKLVPLSAFASADAWEAAGAQARHRPSSGGGKRLPVSPVASAQAGAQAQHRRGSGGSERLPASPFASVDAGPRPQVTPCSGGDERPPASPFAAEHAREPQGAVSQQRLSGASDGSAAFMGARDTVASSTVSRVTGALGSPFETGDIDPLVRKPETTGSLAVPESSPFAGADESPVSEPPRKATAGRAWGAQLPADSAWGSRPLPPEGQQSGSGSGLHAREVKSAAEATPCPEEAAARRQRRVASDVGRSGAKPKMLSLPFSLSEDVEELMGLHAQLLGDTRARGSLGGNARPGSLEQAREGGSDSLAGGGSGGHGGGTGGRLRD